MKTETQELQVLQPELTSVVEKSKIELTKAQSHALAFAPLMQQYHDLALVLSDLDKENPGKEDAKKAREARLKMVKIRTGAETIKDERKSILLTESNLIQDLHNVVKNTCVLTEAEFMSVEKHQERIETERLEKVSAERVLLLEPYGELNKFVDLKMMDETAFNEYLSTVKLAFETRLAQEKQAEIDRIEAEKKAEAERLAKQEADRVEAERIRKENAELKLAQEKREAEIAEQNRLAKIEQDKKDALAKIESDKQAKIQAELKSENDRVNAELKAKKEAEEFALQQEKSRIESEVAEKLAKEKALANAGDKEKVKVFYEKYISLISEFPELSTAEGKAMQVRVSEALGMVKKLIITDSKSLL